MPYLFCKTHGLEHEAETVGNQDTYRQEDEIVLIVNGKLTSGPWRCDSCNAQVRKGDQATLISAFPCHCRESLYDYDFAYELEYFAMTKNDQATSYGADWPDDSIRNRRHVRRGGRQDESRPLCALDFGKNL